MTGRKAGVTSELSRELSLFHLTMMGLGMMIGAGVFVGIGNATQAAGPGGVILTFALNGVLAICTAMSYAELSSAVPRAGGAYNFARMAFGRETSFLAGWMEWFASSVAGSLYAVTFAAYVLRFFREIGWLTLGAEHHFLATKAAAVGVAAFFIYINYRGAAETGRVGAFFTLGQTLFLVFIGVVGLWVAVREPSRLSNFSPFLPNRWTRLLATMGFTYVAFEGYEVIAQAGDEAINPRSTLPKAMLYSVWIVTLTYVATAFATVVAIKPGSVEGAPWEWIGRHGDLGFGEAVARLMPFGNVLLTLAVVFASTSALNATIYSATRASFALGRDRMLPSVFAAIGRRRTPWAALLFTGGIVAALAAFIPRTKDVASSASIMFIFLFLLVNACVIRIRRHMGDELQYGFLMPFFPVLPLLAIACQALLAGHLFHESWMAWAVAAGWIGGGGLVYLSYSRLRAAPTPDEVRVIEEAPAPPGEGYRIMVAVANPDNALELVRNTYKICHAKSGRIELLHMVPVPEQVPLANAERYMMAGKEGIVEAMLYLMPQFPLSTTIRYCRSIARGIVAAVREKRTDLLIMGWHGRRERGLFAIGSTIDPVIERAPCHVAVMKRCGNRKFRRVLVPVAGGPNGALAVEIASMLLEPGGRIVAFNVVGRKGPFDVAAFARAQRERLHLSPEQLATKAVSGERVVRSILEEGKAYDLIVMGCTRRPWLAQFARGSVPETVADRSDKPVVLVRAAGGIRSWIGRWI